MARLIESAHLIRALLDTWAIGFDGQHYWVHAEARLTGGTAEGRVPLLVGGNGTRCCGTGRTHRHCRPGGISHMRRHPGQFTHFDAIDWPTGSPWYTSRGRRSLSHWLNALIQAVVCTNDRNAAAAELAATLGGSRPSGSSVAVSAAPVPTSRWRSSPRGGGGSVSAIGRCSTIRLAARRQCATSPSEAAHEERTKTRCA